MPDVELKTSYFLAQSQDQVRQITLGDLLDDLARNAGDCEALVEITLEGQIGRRWTYGQLCADSRRLAAALASRFSKGEKVAVWAPNIPEWVMMQNACALAGLVLVTVNPAYQMAELRYVLDQSQACALFMIESIRGNPMKEIAEKALDGLDHVREVTNMQDKAAMLAGYDPNTTLPQVLPTDPMQIQ